MKLKRISMILFIKYVIVGELTTTQQVALISLIHKKI